MQRWVIPQKGNGLTSTINESELLDAEDSSSVYNWNGSLYHYNWNTKDAVAGYFWQIGTKLDDGQMYMANVVLR